jgi:hypothetical protein
LNEANRAESAGECRIGSLLEPARRADTDPRADRQLPDLKWPTQTSVMVAFERSLRHYQKSKARGAWNALRCTKLFLRSCPLDSGSAEPLSGCRNPHVVRTTGGSWPE